MQLTIAGRGANTEGILVKSIRTLPRVLLVSVMMVLVLVPSMGAAWVFCGVATYYVAHWAVRRVGVAEESEADVAGLADEQNTGDYARGLLARRKACCYLR